MWGFVRRGKLVVRRAGLQVLVRKLFVNLFWNSLGPLLLFRVIDTFQEKSPSPADVDDEIEFAMSYDFLGLTIAPLQVREEIASLLRLIKEQRPRIVLEIGTCSGGSLYLFSRVAAPDAVLISVDLPGGNFGGGYPLWKTMLYKSFALVNQNIFLIRGDSHSENTLERVKAALDGAKVDFLFIDGDHTYNGVSKDFAAYSALVRKDGIVALHDVVVDEDPAIGVSDFWMEIREKFDSREIIHNTGQGWAGIGVVRL